MKLCAQPGLRQLGRTSSRSRSCSRRCRSLLWPNHPMPSPPTMSWAASACLTHGPSSSEPSMGAECSPQLPSEDAVTVNHDSRLFLLPPSPLELVRGLSVQGHEEEEVPGFLGGARRASSLRLLCCSSRPSRGAWLGAGDRPGGGGSWGGAELCRAHVASGPTFGRWKKEGIQHQLGAEARSQPGGARSPLLEGGLWGEIPPLRSPDEDCAVLVPACDFRLLMQHRSFWSNPLSPAPCPSESTPMSCVRGLRARLTFAGTCRAALRCQGTAQPALPRCFPG